MPPTPSRRRPGRLAAAVVTAVAAAAALLGQAAPARAATPATAPAASWQTDGTVYAVAYLGGAVYLGGSFGQVRSPDGSASAVRRNAAAFDAATGELLPWDPDVDGTVRALAAAPDGSAVYLGGTFGTVGGAARKNAAAVTPGGGTPTAWAPRAGASVRAVAVSGDGATVYLGGGFTSVGAAPRLHAAAVSAGSGVVVDGWRADAEGATAPNVTTIAVAGGTVYLGGSFTTVNGSSRANAAAVAASTGAVQSWKPSVPATVLGIAYDAGRVYIAGRGTGGLLRAYSRSSGATVWRSDTDGDVQAIAVRGGELYAGGHFDTVRGLTRHHLAALDPASGAPLAWDPGVNGTYGVGALATAPTRIAVGGGFTVVGGRPQQGFAQFAG